MGEGNGLGKWELNDELPRATSLKTDKKEETQQWEKPSLCTPFSESGPSYMVIVPENLRYKWEEK